ncbi:hypothetical protein SODALDRAFT_331260 [Sodiomyces alkalinus F11]|uniref:YCII-related domain-containing protein n=1 Tax=Sodiomyces alkalinus (strain CBS 110278 / VKM F-3762 / F11) TaxID=1314773 RepID=A0A3N2Q440_SODAK|nr:hypothetical protein SODALDRAFT_331260 [Sodiomyces alkalinus F11]ROT41519.1 hypothetical protein SODALDRAFT_331260 [Sodiomyces alkalinus F11]
MASRLFPRPSSLLNSVRLRSPGPFIAHHTTFRMSSSSVPLKYEWLVVVPDKPGVKAKRLEVRPTHFADLKPKFDAGIYKMGGALLDEVPEDESDPSSFKFSGSTLVCIAETREEVLEHLKNDIYTKTGVWDLDNVQIWPFKCAFRAP